MKPFEVINENRDQLSFGLIFQTLPDFELEILETILI
jgi:hypothetical protein